jgi:aminoglycoside 3-N-acetyltransferase
MVPTFNHGAAEVFDIKTTPSRNGLITETFRQLQGARRSLHPTHPYAAIGKDAEWLISGHLKAGTFGVNSPLGKLAQRGGYVLMLGAPFHTCTAAHIGENKAQVHCIGWWQSKRRILLDDGTILAVAGDVWRNGKCQIEWDPLEARMRGLNLIRDAKIGDSHTMLMRAMDVIEVTYQMTTEFCPTCPTMARHNG